MDDHLLQHLTPAALARNELFQGLSTDELERLSQRLRFRRAKKGAVLCKEGDPSDSMYIIEAGQIRVYKETPDGRILLATAGPGSHVGEMALLTGDARSATLVVSIDAELWELTKGDFDEVLREYPGIPLTFSRVLAKRLSQADRRIVLEETSHLVALVGTPQEAVRLAESVHRQSGRTVLLLDLVETGDECSTIDPADPFHDVIGIAEGVSRVDVPVEVSSGDFSEIASRLLLRYNHLLVRLPEYSGTYLYQALDLCDSVIIFGQQLDHWVFRSPMPANRIWQVLGPDHRRYTPERGERDIDRLARRVAHMSVGLALSSGAAHGLAHIGVLRMLVQNQIPIDMVAGTSMGSLIGAAFVSGSDPDGLYKLGKEFSGFKKLSAWRIWDFQFPRSGVVRGNAAKRWIDHWTRGKSFEDLEIPFFVVAAEVLTGHPVTFSTGRLSDAVRASVSMPGVMQPVLYKDEFLVDGGQVDPVPCSTLQEAGADIIIASNAIPQVEDRKYRSVRMKVGPGRPPTIFEIYNSMREIMEAQIAILKMAPYDVLISPKVGMYSALEAERLDEFVRLGEEAANAQIDQIKELLKPGAVRKRARA
ncbi:MAG TPA: cyclic nucleotide-binding and patatin-like phospholipase domain-containing protein [Chloroflexia bacterium]|jgi:NTE family protein|nr:cyclic nucleotide-binding and patatin-like phospholipase domain-containing protein [Chloroflexia bacterium]